MLLGEPKHLWSAQSRSRSPAQAGQGSAGGGTGRGGSAGLSSQAAQAHQFLLAGPVLSAQVPLRPWG